MFHVGQKVACIRDSYYGGPTDVFEPIVGSVYTIRSIRVDVLRPQYGVSLVFEEITNSIDRGGREPGFYSSRFRPIVERKTDISIFTAMLTPNKVEA